MHTTIAKSALLTLVSGCIITAGTWLFAYYATHPPRRRVGAWRGDDLPVQDVCFPSSDGLLLRGWFAPAPEAKGAVILCHGHPANRTEMLPEARLLHDAGFHVLLFDFRAMGDSEGKVCTLGANEILDLTGAIDFLLSREEMQGLKLGVFGLSMGGAVSLMTTALDARIHAVATHGAFATLENAIHSRATLFSGPFAPITGALAHRIGRHWIPEQDITPYSAISQISPRPVLLLHGGRDNIISSYNAELLFYEAEEPKQMVILPKSYHVSVDASEQEVYNRHVLDFFTQALT